MDILNRNGKFEEMMLEEMMTLQEEGEKSDTLSNTAQQCPTDNPHLQLASACRFRVLLVSITAAKKSDPSFALPDILD